MNELEVNNTMTKIKEVLSKMDLEIEKELSTHELLVSCGDIGMSDLVPAYLVVTIEEQRVGVSLEICLQCEINESSMTKAIEFVNLVNRLPIIGHFFIQPGENKIHGKKDITLVQGRLNKAELRQSIQALIDNASFYYEEIFQWFNYKDFTEDDRQCWIAGSYLHKGCQSPQ